MCLAVGARRAVPLAKFAQGLYTLQANIVDLPAQTYTFRRINFAVR